MTTRSALPAAWDLPEAFRLRVGKRVGRQRLMQHFGGLQGISRAGVDDLERVPGISRALAQRIYDVMHD